MSIWQKEIWEELLVKYQYEPFSGLDCISDDWKQVVGETRNSIFQILDWQLFIFWQNLITQKVDLDSFSHFRWNYFKDKDHIYYYELSYPRELKILEDADLDSFEVLVGTDYSKDNKHVYIQDLKIKWAKPKTFKVLTNNYWKDDERVFLNWKEIEWADPGSFEVLIDEGSPEDYSKDNKHVYIQDLKIKWAKPKTFKVLDKNYTKDDESVFFYWKKIDW